jgi:glycosyltransferase involved in cell wall biosynthesis
VVDPTHFLKSKLCFYLQVSGIFKKFQWPFSGRYRTKVKRKNSDKTKANTEPAKDGRSDDPRTELDRLVQLTALKMKLNELRLVKVYEKREQNIKVSIIMPTWNRVSVISRAIESVLRQSYKNYELIISDDGSTDNSEKIIKSHYEKDDRIKYIRTSHLGVSHARNVGLERSTGHLIAYLDSDNMWLENYLLLMVNSFIENPDVETMYCGLRVMNNVRKEYYTLLRKYDRKSLLNRNFIDINIFMHKRSLFELLGGFDEQLPPLEDWELIIRYTKTSPPFLLNCCLANYYIEKHLEHITFTRWEDETYRKIRRMYHDES